MMTVTSLRAFSRFYTRHFGLLGSTLPGSDFSLPEARLLYELSHGNNPIAREIAEALDMDKGQLSRVVGRLKKAGFVETRKLARPGSPETLALTADGRAAFEGLNRATEKDVAERLESISKSQRTDLSLFLDSTRFLLGDEPSQAVLEASKPGDIGWVIARQSLLYHSEYGWNAEYEGLISQIFGDYLVGFDPAREDGWIARCGAAIAGSIFLMKSDDIEVAKLRLLYVEPWARGQGLGTRLVRRCIARAREFGYRRLVLWTNDVLVSARRIYEAEGFTLTEEKTHRSFGKNLVGQTWELALDSESA